MADNSHDRTEAPSVAPHGPRSSAKLAGRLLSVPAALALADQAIISASNFATNIIVGRSTSQQEFGAYILALSLLYMAKGVQETLVAAPFVVFRQRKTGEGLTAYRGSNAAYQALTTLAVLLGIPILALLLSQLGASSHLIRAGFIMLAAAPFLMLREYLRRVSFAEFRFGLALAMDATITFVQLMGLMTLWQLGHMNALMAFGAIGAACLVGGMLWILRRPVDFQLDRSRLFSDWYDDFAFGRWALLTFLVGCSTPYIMPWLLGLYRGEISVARFGAAQTLVGLANMFVLGVNNILGPQAAKSFASGGAAKLLRTLSITSLVFVLTLGTFTSTLWVCGDALSQLAWGGEYPALRNTMVMLATAMLFGSLKMTGGSGLSAIHKPKLNFPGDITMLVVSLGAGIPLTLRFAESGTAAGVALGAAAACAVRWWTVFVCVRKERDHECAVEANRGEQLARALASEHIEVARP